MSPQVLSGSSSLAVLSTSNGLVVALTSQSDGWIGVVPTEGEVVWSTLTHDEHGNFSWYVLFVTFHTLIS